MNTQDIQLQENPHRGDQTGESKRREVAAFENSSPAPSPAGLFTTPADYAAGRETMRAYLLTQRFEHLDLAQDLRRIGEPMMAELEEQHAARIQQQIDAL